MTAPNLVSRMDRGPLDVEEARKLAADVCLGLRAAHARGRVALPLAAEQLTWVWDGWVIEGLKPRRGDEREDVRELGALLQMALGAAEPLALPQELRGQILRSQHGRADRRYGTVEEMTRALGVDLPPPPVRRRGPVVVAAVAALLAAGGVTRAPAPVHAPVFAPVAEPAAPQVLRVAVARFDAPAPAFEDDGWLGDGVTDMLATVLAEREGLETASAGGGDADVTVTGKVEAALEGDGLVVEVRLIAGGATRLAERVEVASRARLFEAVDGLAGRIARGLGGGPGPGLTALTTGSLPAYEAYVEGDFARAAALDPSYFQPRARRGDLAGARALVGRAGRRGAALLAQMETAERARASRAAGRWAACAEDAERAGLLADLAWCRLASGDLAGARAAAEDAGDPVLAGDLFLVAGDYGRARAAYGKAGAAARLLLVDLRARGRCRAAVDVKTLEDGLVEAALARACGDWDRARAVETWMTSRDAALAEELAVVRLVSRGDRSALDRARRQLEAAPGAAVAGSSRSRRQGSWLAATRATGARAALTGFVVEPGDRWGLFEEPLLWEVAMTELAAGDAEAGALACGEVAAAAPGWTPSLYCAGRAAEAAGDTGAAFKAYRELLDRWTAADEENRLLRDARRRLKMIIAQAQARRG